jgi:hypothetical protein
VGVRRTGENEGESAADEAPLDAVVDKDVLIELNEELFELPENCFV